MKDNVVMITICSWTLIPIILPTSHMHTFHTNHQLPHTPVDHHLDYKRLAHTPPHCEVLFHIVYISISERLNLVCLSVTDPVCLLFTIPCCLPLDCLLFSGL